MKHKTLYLQRKVFCNRIVACLFCFIACYSQAVAENLPDPTRPFDTVASSIEQSGPILQSVLISPSSRVAIIDGKRVKLGDKYSGARLVRLDKNEAELRGIAGTKTLSIFRNVAKNDIRLEKRPNIRIPVSSSTLAHVK